jgi:hypothetical protein
MLATIKKEQVEEFRKLRWRCRTDLLFLCNYVLGYPDVRPDVHKHVIGKLQKFKVPTEIEAIENDRYDSQKRTWVYRPVCRHEDLEGSRFTLILDSRSFLKTSINTIAHSIQYILNYPNITILVTVANEDRAATIVKEITEHFRSNQLFRTLFPEHCPDEKQLKTWGNLSGFTTEARDFSYEEVKVKRENTITVGSIEAGIASRHFDVIKASDIVDDKNSENAEQCQYIANRFSLLHPARVNDLSWIYLEGTRYHETDIYGQIIEDERLRVAQGRPPKYSVYFRSCFERENATYDIHDLDKPFLKVDDKYVSTFPFDPKRGKGFSVETLLRMRDDPIEGLNFNCQYLNDPTPTDEAVLPVDKERPRLKDPAIFYSKVPIAYREMAVDFAETQKVRSDNTAISVMAWDNASRPYVEDIQVGKFTQEEALALLIQMYRKYNPRVVFIEDVSYTRGMSATLEKAFQALNLYPCWEWIKRPPQQKKHARIKAALGIWWRSKALQFVYDASKRDVRGIKNDAYQQLLKEARPFPRGKNDDILDTLADLFRDKDYFGRLGPRTVEEVMADPNDQTNYQKWQNSEAGQRAWDSFLGYEQVNWDTANKFGAP